MIEFNAKVKDSWIRYLQEFREDVYPTFKHFDISFEVALMLWNDNTLKNSLDSFIESITDDGEGWK
jgi:hypothetical protein